MKNKNGLSSYRINLTINNILKQIKIGRFFEVAIVLFRITIRIPAKTENN